MSKTIEFQMLAPEFDVMTAAPESHKMLFENEKVRVLEVIILSGKKEPVHYHQWPSVMIVDQSADIRYHSADGKFFDIKRKDSDKTHTEWMEPEDLHAVENIDKKTYHAFRIELKQSE